MTGYLILLIGILIGIFIGVIISACVYFNGTLDVITTNGNETELMLNVVDIDRLRKKNYILLDIKRINRLTQK